ncbi:MAG TPA: hypoxanthine phosphoribosyltransferase [Armatimonadetes bacterium]|nr:hypoxanthine phosphoribosyltransferase [Armatimonadota bacterium]
MAHFWEREIERIILTADQIRDAVQRLGEQITKDYQGKELHVVGVLRGATLFTAELVQAIDLPLTMDFIGITSYTPSARGVVRITKDLDESIQRRHVLVTECIVDTGLTLSYILRNLQTREPASIAVCALLDKYVRRIIDVPIAYRGFELPYVFVVGYGLDWHQRYRNLPFIATLKPEVLEGNAQQARQR